MDRLRFQETPCRKPKLWDHRFGSNYRLFLKSLLQVPPVLFDHDLTCGTQGFCAPLHSRMEVLASRKAPGSEREGSRTSQPLLCGLDPYSHSGLKASKVSTKGIFITCLLKMNQMVNKNLRKPQKSHPFGDQIFRLSAQLSTNA